MARVVFPRTECPAPSLTTDPRSALSRPTPAEDHMTPVRYQCTTPACPAGRGREHHFDVRFPQGTEPTSTPCPACGSDAERVAAELVG